MKITDRLYSYLAKQVVDRMKRNPGGAASTDLFVPGYPLTNINDPDVMMDVLKKDVWVYVSVNTIGRSLSEAPLIVETLKSVDAKPTWERVESGPLVDILKQPNEYEAMDFFIWRLVMALMTGDAFILVDKKSTPNHLYHVQTDLVKVIKTADGTVEKYQVGAVPNIRYFPPEEIVHIKLPAPNDDTYGLSPIHSDKNYIYISQYYTTFLKDFFANGSVPAGLLTTDIPGIGADAKKQTIKDWLSLFAFKRGKAGSIGVLDSGFKYQQITPSLDSLIVDMLHKMPREAILATFGLPPVMAGIYEYANYANADAQVKIFWQNCIMPMQRLICGSLNVQLVSQYGKNLRIRADISQIKALQEDETIRSTRLTKYVGGGIMTPNEAREEIGLEPLDGGDELRQPSAFGIGAFGDASNQGGDTGKMLETPSPSSVKAALPGGPRLEYVNAHVKTVTRYENGLKKIMRRYFDAQLDRVLGSLDILVVMGRVNAALLYAAMQKKDVGDDVGDIFNRQSENKELIEAVDAFVKQMIAASGQAAIDTVGVNTQFNVDNPKVQVMIDKFQNRIKSINDTTWDEIKGVLQQAYDDGWTLSDIEKELRSRYSQFGKSRAEMIARTETNGIVNKASLEGYRETGVVEKKEWIATQDSVTRDAHAEADGQIVGLDEYFIVGGELLQCPGDPNGSAENVIQCRCAVAPVVA